MENFANINEMMRQPIVNQNYRNGGLVKNENINENMPEINQMYSEPRNQYDSQSPYILGICYVPMQEWDSVR